MPLIACLARAAVVVLIPGCCRRDRRGVIPRLALVDLAGQTAVARQAGLSRSYYAQVEHARQAISVDRAFALANVLGVEMTELFTAFPAVPHARPY